MARAARILILGTNIPFRKELAEHREIEKRFANSAAEAAAQLRPSRVDACVVCSDFDDQDVIWLMRQSMPKAPIIVFSSSVERAAKWPKDIADVVVSEEEIDSLVVLVAKHTGLRLARHPRADISMPLKINADSDTSTVESIDMSLSGVAVVGYSGEELELGTQVDVVLEFPDGNHHAVAEVVRWFDHDLGRAMGLQFRSLAESTRSAISSAVDNELSHMPEQWEIDELFGDLGLESEPSYQHALRTLDVQASPRPAFIPSTSDLELPQLRSVIAGDPTCSPGWMRDLAEKLTEVEVAAVLGKASPDWVYQVLQVRLNLARVRFERPHEAPPSSLLDEGYRTFTKLSREASTASGPIQSQVRTIRAAILRDLTSGPKIIAANRAEESAPRKVA